MLIYSDSLHMDHICLSDQTERKKEMAQYDIKCTKKKIQEKENNLIN